MPALDKGRYEIWLGGLFWQQPIITGGALPATDNFNRADENPLSNGGKWTVVTNGANPRIVSNAVNSDTNGFYGGARWNADVFNSDHYGQVVIVTLNMNAAIGPGCRMDGTLNDLSAYHWEHTDPNTNTIVKYVTGTRTVLSTPNATFANGDTAKIDASGSTITVYRNGVSVASTTDTALTGGASGLITQSSNNFLDDWQGDNLAAAAAVLPGHGHLLALKRNRAIQHV